MEERVACLVQGSRQQGIGGGGGGQEIRAAGLKRRGTEGRLPIGARRGRDAAPSCKKRAFIYEVSLAGAKNKPCLYLHGV